MLESMFLSIFLDASHFKGEPAVFLDSGPTIVSPLGVGIDKRLAQTNTVSFDMGAFYLFKTNELMGTNLNFIITVRYKKLIYRHISHGATFGIAANKANAGYNFIGLEFQL